MVLEPVIWDDGRGGFRAEQVVTVTDDGWRSLSELDVGRLGVTTTDHRERIVAAMREQEIDVLLLGREANARYVSGADRLWLAGTRPFAPGCVLVGSTGAVHVLSTTDDGIPSDIPNDRLYPISWNPLAILGHIAGSTASPARGASAPTA